MTYINQEHLKDTWPIELWLRVSTTQEALTIDWYREKYDKKNFWEKKFWDKAQMLFEYESKAQVYPEFSKVTAISYAINDWEVMQLNGSEESILKQLNELFKELDELAWMKKIKLCWFNLYGHDIPYLWKRMVVNWIKPNHHLRIAKIPIYQINNYIWDLNQLWKQSSFSAEAPLVIYCLLNEKPEWDPYASSNCSRMLDKTRQAWRKIYNLFLTSD